MDSLLSICAAMLRSRHHRIRRRLLPIADTRLLTEMVDGVVMVIASEQTSSDAVATALRESPGIRDRIVGVALNRAPDEFDRYYRERDKATKRIGAQRAAGDSHGE